MPITVHLSTELSEAIKVTFAEQSLIKNTHRPADFTNTNDTVLERVNGAFTQHEVGVERQRTRTVSSANADRSVCSRLKQSTV